MTVTRFAPSPTGYLHLGHAHSALTGWHRARADSGRFLLRIEDIDLVRCRPEFEAAILEDLAWLGHDWDGPVRRQSEHLPDYQAALDRLRGLGLLYPCFCSRKDIAAATTAPHGPEGAIYPGTCRNLPAGLVAERLAHGEYYALRLDVAKARAISGPLSFEDEREGLVGARPETLGDVVLARRDAPASYHLCVTLDDHLQGVTLVTRGVDLFHATHIHRLIQAVLGLNVPTYAHHLLLTNAAGERLSKRDGATALCALRCAGRSAAEVRAMAGFGGQGRVGQG
jgi:glutamyl-Q tRNA(Asp) synthetase